MPNEQATKKGPTYVLNLEGEDHDWDEPTITPNQIREVAGWDARQPIVEVNLDDNSERTLSEGEVVTLKPGHGFGKKVKFQRG
jgi:hypothetical protein